LNGDGGGSGERWIARVVALRWIGRKGPRFGEGKEAQWDPRVGGSIGKLPQEIVFWDQNIFTPLPIT
jgi:hypothetical protein